MDGQRFDEITRAFARGTSRRRVLKGIAGGILGGAAAVMRHRGMAADKVAVCHMTGSATNPVVLITVSSNAIPAHEAHGDVINPDFQNDVNNCGGCLISCDDGDPCTIDTCAGGQCVHTPVVCTSSNPCMDSACAGGTCVDTPAVGRSCDDGNACTENDACDATGACVGSPVSCDDGDLCTIDSCDPATGCAHTPVDCSGSDDQCHVGVCNSTNGACEQQPANEGQACDDNNVCTVEATCDASGACVGTPLVCVSLDLCKTATGECDPTTGCVFVDTDCSSFDDQCNVGVCDQGLGCHAQPANEGDSCTTTTDVAGTCASGTCVPNHCENAVLASSAAGAGVFVDDELRVNVNGVQVYQHLGASGPLGQIPLGPVTNGDQIEVVANNSSVFCGFESLTPLYLICNDNGVTQTLDANGFPQEANKPCGEVFYDQTFTVAI